MRSKFRIPIDHRIQTSTDIGSQVTGSILYVLRGEVFLLSCQEPNTATVKYHEPDESAPNLPLNFFNVVFNVTYPSVSRSSKLSSSLRFLKQNVYLSVCTTSLADHIFLD
jgi:hypothetical protein